MLTKSKPQNRSAVGMRVKIGICAQVKKSMAKGRFHPPHVTDYLVHKASEKFLSIFTKGTCKKNYSRAMLLIEMARIP